MYLDHCRFRSPHLVSMTKKLGDVTRSESPFQCGGALRNAKKYKTF